MVSVAIRIGAASQPSREATITLHTKIGSRDQVMPGARMRSTVISILIADQAHREPIRRNDQITVHPPVRFVGERRVAGPAGGKPFPRDRRHQHEPGERCEPERQRLDARERHPPCTDHQRDEIVPRTAPGYEGLDVIMIDHRPVQADERDVLAGRPCLLIRRRELGSGSASRSGRRSGRTRRRRRSTGCRVSLVIGGKQEEAG